MTLKKGVLSKVVSSSIIRKSSNIDTNSAEIIDDESNKYSTLAPYDDPLEILKNAAKSKRAEPPFFIFERLSLTEIKLLKYIGSKINKDGNTLPMYLSDLTLEVGHPITTLKKTIQRLENKGFLKRVSYKAGRGGWTIYSMTKEVKDKLEKI